MVESLETAAVMEMEETVGTVAQTPGGLAVDSKAECLVVDWETESMVVAAPEVVTEAEEASLAVVGAAVARW